MKVDNLKFHWQHNQQQVVLRMNRFNKPIYVTRGTTQCFVVRESETPATLASVIFIHKDNHFNRKVGVYEAFKLVMKKCPQKDLRVKAWNTFWEIRKPTITVSEDTAELLSCVDYVGCKIKQLIQEDDGKIDPVTKENYNHEWWKWDRRELTKRIAGRAGMYREGSDYSLITLGKLIVIGFINFKRKKDEAILSKNSK